jgi:hypothetical protein
MSVHKRGCFPLIAEDELSEVALRSSLGMTTKGAHSRMRKTLNQLEKEEIALLKTEQLVQTIAFALEPEDKAFDALVALRSRLEQRHEQKEYLRDFAPLMQQLLPHLDEQVFAPEKKYLDALSKGTIGEIEREPLIAQLAALQVNKRFGGDRSQEHERNVLALTHEGQQEMMRRFPVKNIVVKHAPIKREHIPINDTAPVIHPPSAQAQASSQLSSFMHNMVRADYLHAPEIPDTLLLNTKEYVSKVDDSTRDLGRLGQ